MLRRNIRIHRKENAQGMVEFALILPILLLVVVGIMEMGRLLFFYSSVVSASREGARYASAAGEVGGVPRYSDCVGIKDAALKAGSFAGLAEGDIAILYDDGSSVTDSSCPPNAGVALADRVVVTASGLFNPVVPLISVFFPDDGLEVNSVTARTIIKDVGIEGTPQPTNTPAPTPTPVCPPHSWSPESDVNNTLTLSITNNDLDYVYYLREIEVLWPGGGPQLETITFSNIITGTSGLTTFELTPYDNAPKFKTDPIYPVDDPDIPPYLVWQGRFQNPGLLEFTFDQEEPFTPGDLYTVKVTFTGCSVYTTNYVIPTPIPYP